MTDYRHEIETIAMQRGLDPDLVEALVIIESGGHADAFRYEPAFWKRYLQGKPEWADCVPRRVSSSYGLCQVMYPVAKELGFSGVPELLFVPTTNLTWGCLKLSQLLQWANGDEERALCAYNGGKLQNVKRPFRNQAYAAKVLAQKQRMIT